MDKNNKQDDYIELKKKILMDLKIWKKILVTL